MSALARCAAAALLAALSACQSTSGPLVPHPLPQRAPPRAIPSLLGKPLPYAPPAPERRVELERELEAAWERHARQPRSEDGIIWLGRRLAYLGRYDEAIEVYSRGLDEHPRSFRLLRHRGHRFITTRRLDDAVADLSRARSLIRGVPDEVEPDGAPNAFGLPRSTNHSNVLYHLGLALYLQGRFDEALETYRECMRFSAGNDDMLCATSYWLMMTASRAGRPAEALSALAPIHADMDILENFAYHRLLLFYKGVISERQLLSAPGEHDYSGPTTAYGYGNWHLINGRPTRAEEVFREIVVKGEAVHAFGSIAAEAELARAGVVTSNAR